MRTSFALPLLLSLAAIPAHAQNWNPEQTAVLSFVEGCWQAWTEAVASHDITKWTDRCPHTENIRWWWMPDPVPETAATLDRQFAWQVEHIERVVWWDVRPIAITLAGEVAIVMFYAEGSWIGTDGAPVSFGSKRLELFQRRDGQWTFLGGMVSPTEPSTR